MELPVLCYSIARIKYFYMVEMLLYAKKLLFYHER